MNISGPFIRRPAATTLLTVAAALAGMVAFRLLPVSPLPQVDFPTISVNASLAGASPEIMASSVATPLEREFGRISDITEMTSTSTLGQTSVTLVFDLNRNIDAAARDVEAAINAARSYLPTNLQSNPTYRKVNPADAPIMIISLSSETLAPADLYDVASTVLEQKLSQITGVGQVLVGGSSAPAVRIDLNPTQLNAYGLQLETVRTVVAAQTVNEAKGRFTTGHQHTTITANDQLMKAADYKPLILSYKNNAPVRLMDVAMVTDSVQTVRSLGLVNGKPAASIIIFRQPGANIIDTVDGIKAALPQLHAAISPSIDMTIALDQTVTIRASVVDVERTLLLSVLLVVLVVFVFLREWRATFIPAVAVPVSLIATFGIMYLAGYSVDNLSLMALTIATGFVVDDAIVVLENITRYREQGMKPIEAALTGAAEIGSTVFSISVSLVAVFIPILMMGGIIGRLFREFAVVLSVTIIMSMVVSLTTTPMMCARILSSEKGHGKFYNWSERIFTWILAKYEGSLRWVLERSFIMLLATIGMIALTVYLAVIVPKGFFPQEDTGRIAGQVVADEAISFNAMKQKMHQLVEIVQKDKAVASVVAFTGGGGGTTTNSGRAFIALKPLAERPNSGADLVINRLRPQLAKVPGATLFLQSVQDVRVGGRLTSAQYQYTIQSDSVEELAIWGPRLLATMKELPALADVNTDAQNRGLSANLTIDRKTAARMGINPNTIDQTLYDAFGERQIAKTYTAINQYFVIMEVAPEYWATPAGLHDIYVSSGLGGVVPLSAFTHYAAQTASLGVNHSGVFPSQTISFNLKPGISLGQAVTAISEAELKIGLPSTVTGAFSGTAEAYTSSLANEPYLIAAALAAVYIVLGILYESFVHPITILSTLPSASAGAILALLATGTELSLIALIGIILLIGIVKKNAIMMIDFALEVERREHKTPKEAAFQACLLRFRPIMMTTMAAMLGSLPLAFGTGMGSELRRPLGITIVGGLIVSQMLTLYSTPVIYVYMDRLNNWVGRLGFGNNPGASDTPVSTPASDPA